MQPFIEATQGELKSLCRRHHVRRLELFGSAAAGVFEPTSSDLDFLVEFENLDPPAFADAYFGLQEALSELYQRPVDLVIPAAVHNLLTGTAPAGQADTGKIVCSCFAVGENAIRGAIAGGCGSVEAIGQRLKAGTNCGSCVPELRGLIAQQAVKKIA